jgi:hypothetical protein
MVLLLASILIEFSAKGIENMETFPEKGDIKSPFFWRIY